MQKVLRAVSLACLTLLVTSAALAGELQVGLSDKYPIPDEVLEAAAPKGVELKISRLTDLRLAAELAGSHYDILIGEDLWFRMARPEDLAATPIGWSPMVVAIDVDLEERNLRWLDTGSLVTAQEIIQAANDGFIPLRAIEPNSSSSDALSFLQFASFITGNARDGDEAEQEIRRFFDLQKGSRKDALAMLASEYEILRSNAQDGSAMAVFYPVDAPVHARLVAVVLDSADGDRLAAEQLVDALTGAASQRALVAQGLRGLGAADSAPTFSTELGFRDDVATETERPESERVRKLIEDYRNEINFDKARLTVLLIDCSGSISGGDASDGSKQTEAFVEHLLDPSKARAAGLTPGPSDATLIVTFDTQAHIAGNRGSKHKDLRIDGNAPAQLRDAYTEVRRRLAGGGGTSLYRSLAQTHELLASPELQGYQDRHIVVLSDYVSGDHRQRQQLLRGIDLPPITPIIVGNTAKSSPGMIPAHVTEFVETTDSGEPIDARFDTEQAVREFRDSRNGP